MPTALLMLALALAAAPQGEIALVAVAGGERAVAVADAATGSLRQVGPGPMDGAPQWSPDGTWLAFESASPRGTGVYVVRADGSEGRLLPHRFPRNRGPVWSPDGRHLAYSAGTDEDPQWSLVVFEIESDSETIWGGQRGLLRPSWLPSLFLMTALSAGATIEWEGADGEALLSEAADGILLAAGIVGGPGAYSTEIFLVTKSQAAPLLALLGDESFRYVEWAPKANRLGKAIAFESNDGGDREIFVLGRRGLMDVTNHRAADWNPVWAPGGKWLAFESFRGGTRGVYQVFPDTALVAPIAADPEYDCWSPSWSPDGKWLTYVSTRSGSPQVSLQRGPKGEPLELKLEVDFALAPAWRPGPGKGRP